MGEQFLIVFFFRSPETGFGERRLKKALSENLKALRHRNPCNSARLTEPQPLGAACDRQLRAGGVDCIGAPESFEGTEPVECPDNLFWVGQDGDGVRLLSGAVSVAGFKLAVEDEGGVGEFVGD